MKKLLSIMTLCLCSFFFVFNEEVNADVHTITISGNAEDYLTENFYKMKEYAESYSKENGYYYFIYDNEIVFSNLPEVTVFNDTTWFQNKTQSFVKRCIYDSVNLIFNCEDSNRGFVIQYNKYNTFLHTNISIFSPIERVVIYKGKEYAFNSTNRALSMYDLYLIDNPIEEQNPHQEEINKINNFYTILIEKIGYLADQIATNYILLFTIGIFILIFTFLLIFRRFL